MGFREDFVTATARVNQTQTDLQEAITAAHADMDAVVARLAAALYARLRPLPALDWLTDDKLQRSCRAFAQTAREIATATDPLPRPPETPPT